MGYRIFKDSRGVEWQAWDIIPRLAERRARERRLARAVVERERRGVAERRQQRGDRPVLTNGLNAGWLCFEAPQEKRRLTPIPGDWLRCAVARLEEYLGLAVPARRMNTATELPIIGRLDMRAG